MLSALKSASFPVPNPYLYCGDISVIGTEFYIMEHVQGIIFRKPTLPNHSEDDRKAIYNGMISTLARLHNINWKGLELSDFGHQSNFLGRQISTWRRQYRASETCHIDSVESLLSWLEKNIPVWRQNIVLVHGDFRLDNLIFDPRKLCVNAVLDWELSTLGDPLLDLAYCCLPYHWPKELGHMSSFSLGTGSLAPGIPTEKDLISLYCKFRGLGDIHHEHWNFYIALSFFRMAAIAQGIYARAIHGNASAEDASLFGNLVEPLACAGLKVALQAQASHVSKLNMENVSSIFQPSLKAQRLYQKMIAFMEKYVYPAEESYYQHVSNPATQWSVPPFMEDLKEKAQGEGLWNLFLSSVSGLSQLEYAMLAEVTGRCPFAAEVFNCSAPDTGNMEVLHLYGTTEQKKAWLEPLLKGTVRSAFCMTEPSVASSDATNMECTITRLGSEIVINGTKWWSSGAGDPRCKIAIVMGTSKAPGLSKHRRHTMVLVPLDTPGVTKVRSLTVFGYNDAPHGHYEIEFKDVHVPVSNIILGEGRGFEIAQGRLGPGRIHHCMRLIGLAERSLDLMVHRSLERVAFGKRLSEKGMVQEQIALSRIEIEQARLLVLNAAYNIDKLGNKAAKNQIAMAKIVVPRMACNVIDRAIQIHGGKGVCQDTPLAGFYSQARSLRIADGPDEVHLEAVAKSELKRALTAKI